MGRDYGWLAKGDVPETRSGQDLVVPWRRSVEADVLSLGEYLASVFAGVALTSRSSQQTALRELLEHFRAVKLQPKLVLCLFLDIGDMGDFDLKSKSIGVDPTLQNSLAPTIKRTADFIAEHVRPHADSCDFDLIVHATEPVEHVNMGADRAYTPTVDVQCRKDGFADLKAIAAASRRKKPPKVTEDFKFKTFSKELGRLLGEVNAHAPRQQDQNNPFLALAAIAAGGNPQLALQMAALFAGF